MPYSIRRIGSKFKVVTTDTGKVHGTHPSRARAEAQLRALYANAPPEKEPVAKRWAKEFGGKR